MCHHYSLCRAFTVRSVFSAVEAQKSKSSMVAMNVASFPSAVISVTTWLFFLVVLMVKPLGVLKLSGDTALAMASAVFASAYSRVIVACKVFTFQLFFHEVVDGFYEVFKLVYGHLGACGYVVSSAFSAVLL